MLQVAEETLHRASAQFRPLAGRSPLPPTPLLPAQALAWCTSAWHRRLWSRAVETLIVLLLALVCASILTGLVTLGLRWLGIAPAQPEARTRGIELLWAHLRCRFARPPSSERSER